MSVPKGRNAFVERNPKPAPAADRPDVAPAKAGPARRHHPYARPQQAEHAQAPSAQAKELRSARPISGPTTSTQQAAPEPKPAPLADTLPARPAQQFDSRLRPRTKPTPFQKDVALAPASRQSVVSTAMGDYLVPQYAESADIDRGIIGRCQAPSYSTPCEQGVTCVDCGTTLCWSCRGWARVALCCSTRCAC